MAAQTAKGTLAAALGQKARSAYDKSKNDPIDYGRLPVGINNGVAQLVMAKWGLFENGNNKGKPFVTFQGIAKTPLEHNGQKVEGRRVSMTVGIHDDPTRKVQGEPATFANRLALVMNEIKKLGIEGMSESNIDDLEGYLGVLEQTKPHFSFTTRGWTPTPTRENPSPAEVCITEFHGACEPSENGAPAAEAGVQDNTGSDEATAETGGDEQVATDLPEDPDELAALAMEGGNDEAEAKLEELAAAAGVPEEDVTKAADWNAVAELIKAAYAGAEGGDEQVSAEPTKGQVVSYKIADPKNPKKSKLTKCEITSVNTKAGTVTLKNLTTGKPVTMGGKPVNVGFDSIVAD
jgi:hypothetical protein